MNMVKTRYTHICKCKNDTCWNFQESGLGKMGGEKWSGEFKYDIFDTL
jgi:hypothetical protein